MTLCLCSDTLRCFAVCDFHSERKKFRLCSNLYEASNLNTPFFPTFLTFRQKHLSCTGLVMQAVHSFFSNRFQDIKNLGSNRFNWLHSSSKRLKLLLSVVELQYLVCRSNKLRHRRDLKLATVAKCATVALNPKPPFNLCIPFPRQRQSLSKPYLD